MADLEDGEILDSSEDETKNVPHNAAKNNTQEQTKDNPNFTLSSRAEASRVSTLKSASSGYRSNTPDVGSDSSSGTDSEEDTPLWRQKKAKYFRCVSGPMVINYIENTRSQKEQSMVVCSSPTLPEYKPNSPQASQPNPAKKWKNNVWGSVLIEQDLTQTMTRSGQVHEKTEDNYVERNVESYDFSKRYEDSRPKHEEKDSPEKVESNDPFDKVLDSYTSKISRSIVDYEEGYEDLHPDKPKQRGQKRKADIRERLGPTIKKRLGERKEETFTLGEITLSEDTEESELVKKIADFLHEPKVEIIERVVSCLGKAEAIDLTNKTRDIEDNGGMMTKDGGRRRTPGGVYIQLMKFSPKYTSDMHKIIFKEDFEERAKEKRRQKRLRQRQREDRLRKIHASQQNSSGDSLQKPSISKSQQQQRSKERRSWSTESEASNSEEEMESSGRGRPKTSSGEIDFQAELENTRKLILRSKSKENTDCTMEEGQSEGLKEAKSVESLAEDKENMEDHSMSDLLEEESNVIDVPLGDD